MMANFPKSISVGTLISDILVQIGVGNKKLIDSSVHPSVGTLAVKQAEVELDFELTTTTTQENVEVGALLPPVFDLFAATTLGARLATESFKGFKKDTANIKITIVALGIDPAKNERIVIKGFISNEINKPLKDVLVQEKGTSNTVLSDDNGNYAIQVKDQDAFLSFSCVGFIPSEKQTGNQTTINVVMVAKKIVADTGKKITGKITDVKGNPLSGVSIREKTTTNGTLSDKDGRYSITVKDNNAGLDFLFIGFTPVEKKVGNRTAINVTMVAVTKTGGDTTVTTGGFLADLKIALSETVAVSKLGEKVKAKQKVKQLIDELSANYQKITTTGKKAKLITMTKNLQSIKASQARNQIPASITKIEKFVTQWSDELNSIKK